MEIARHRSALVRTELSRPVRLAVADGLLRAGETLMDYGCGRGGDIARVRESGFDCAGWDPVHAPEGERRRSTVVNLGYVVNVIENPGERADVLRSAWGLARETLVVSARLIDERPERSANMLADGVVTRIGTFQKFFEQQELRRWIDTTLDVRCVAAAPGVFYVFRCEAAQAEFVSRRFRRSEPVPRLRLDERLVADNRHLLDELATFLAGRGRLPEAGETDLYDRLRSSLGSLRRAQRLLLLATDASTWGEVSRARAEDLLVYLALAKFDGRPALSALPQAMRWDVKAFFGTYAKACAEADRLLFGLGDQRLRDAAAVGSGVGKLLPNAIYAHVNAVAKLPILLRLYEGCGRAALGVVDGATLVKLRRDEPKVSYLVYPEFEREAHPALSESVSLHLQTLRSRTRHYDRSVNPPVLHRKEAFVAADHPRRDLFASLTKAEERAGLLDDMSRIGTASGWREALAARSLKLRGHRLIRLGVSSG